MRIGTQAVGLALRGHRVTGTDIGPAAAGRAGREGARRGLETPVRAADMRALPFGEGARDHGPGGLSQRVAVARVPALRPRLVLADEPTGQLDHATGQHIIDVLIAAADEIGAALVITTHDPAVAERFAERWEMREGRLRPRHGPPARTGETARREADS
ncbi:hypothetical protein [Streptomyces niveus]|uniref:hypothetical protein n=1 Tax=Streptomyces niveus TaxID=193462 RepID=UPI0036D38BF3